MGIAEIILIAIGTSLDAAGVMICFGAMMPRIKPGTLTRLCLIIAPWQAGVLLVGSGLRHVLPGISESLLMMGGWSLLASLIFLGLGIYMFVKAGKQETVYEYRRDTLETKLIVFTAMALSLDNFFAGVGLGLMNVELLEEFVTVLIAGTAAIIGGIYLGYHWGAEQQNKAYIASGIILCVAGVDVLIRYLA